MSGAGDLLRNGLFALRKNTFWWAFGLVAFAVVNMAFWPSIESSDALADWEQSIPSDLLEIFGAQNLTTPSGYLDAQLYALMLPMLLSAMGVAMASALTSGDETAGRLELVHALPVRRSVVWVCAFLAAMVALALVAALTTAVLVVTRGPFSLDVSAGRLVNATIACAVLGAFHAAVAYAAGGFGASRGLAIGISILVLLGGYVVAFLFPLADVLEGLRVISPWYWSVGEQPVSNGVDWPLIGLLAAVTALLVAAGTVAVTRRDIRGA